MAKLETETKRAIERYYNRKIEFFEKNIREIKENERKKRHNEFKENEIVIEILKSFEVLRELFNDLDLNLHCNYYSGNLHTYENNEDYKKCKNEIEKLYVEKRKLYLKLENNSKNSKEYKEAFNKFLKLLESEEK